MRSSPISSRSSSRPGAETRVVVMARHPIPGRVKTRLAVAIGAAAAAALQRAFILDLADRLADVPYPVSWVYEPADAPFAALLPAARCRPQHGGDLGARMAEAIRAELADGAASVLVIGTDSPHLPLGYLDGAAAALSAGSDVVLGPAEDGGYYLIGVRAEEAVLFTGIAWGTPTVLATTEARAQARGLRTGRLPPLFDVDVPQDLRRLRSVLAAGVVHLPRTAALLDQGP
jgi:uncharacterized protein